MAVTFTLSSMQEARLLCITFPNSVDEIVRANIRSLAEKVKTQWLELLHCGYGLTENDFVVNFSLSGYQEADEDYIAFLEDLLAIVGHEVTIKAVDDLARLWECQLRQRLQEG